MSSQFRKPVIGIPASTLEIVGGRMLASASGNRTIDSLIKHTECLPLIIPALENEYNFKHLADCFDGILLTGGRANIEPHHYGGKPFPPDEPIDPARDNTVLPLIRLCIERQMPIFGICRGIQEMNVAMGGNLYYRVNEIPGKRDHRMPRGENVPMEEIFKLKHMIKLRRNGFFSQLIGQGQTMVNSLHGQSIDRMSDDFEIEATTVDDDVIEGIRLKNDTTFTVGVQWHAEWKPEESVNTLSRHLFEEFGKAVTRYSQSKC